MHPTLLSSSSDQQQLVQREKPLFSQILEIGPIPPPRAGWGIRIEYLMKALAERGVACSALDLGPNRRIKRDNIEDIPSAWGYSRKVFQYLLRGYRIHNHLNGESPKAYLLVLYSAMLGFVFRRRVVLTWHGGLGYRFFPDNGNVLARWIHKLIFGLSSRIICNDELIKRHITDYGVRPDKVVPIQAFSKQYVEHETAVLPVEVTRFLDRRSPLLFCYTLFRPEFYTPVLARALALLQQKHPNFGIAIAGDTAGSEEFVRQIRDCGIEEHVALVGDLPRDAFLTLLGRAEVCVRTHKRDGVSSSVLEALALGVPVVAADNPLRPPQVITYEAESAHGLAEAVASLLDKPPQERRPAAPDIPDTVKQEVDLLMGLS